MPQVETHIERNPKKQGLAVALAGLLIVLIVGGVLAIKFWPKPAAKVETKVALDNADELRSSGNTDGAITTLKRQLAEAKNDDEKVNVYLAIGGAYESKEAYSQALDYYQKAGELRPGFGINSAIARAAAGAGKKSMAVDYYTRNKDLIASGKAPQHQGDLAEIETALKQLEGK